MKYEDRIRKYSELSENNKNNSKQKIGLIIKGNYIASNYIRILSPFSNLSDTQYFPYLIDNSDFNKFRKDLENDDLFLDIIIIQRDAIELDFAELIVEKCNLFGVKIIFEIDDDLINMDKSSPIYNRFLPRIRIMKFLAENSDCITVSTNILRERMLKYNKNVITIPNALVDYWNIHKKINRKNSTRCIKIGYMGTITHTNDLKVIEEVIKKIKRKYSNKEIIFEFIEGTTDDLEGINIIRVPPDDEYYPNFVSWLQGTIDWDIAIAPLLKEDPINLSKSELKYLEYTALNIPGVYSDVGPYAYAIENGKNGMLVKENSSTAWEQQLCKLIENVNLRQEIIINAWKDIEKNYLISNMVNNWINVLDKNKRNKSNVLYKKVKEYYDGDILISFNDFLIEESENIIIESNIFNEDSDFIKYLGMDYYGFSAILDSVSLNSTTFYTNKFFEKIKNENNEKINSLNMHPFVYFALYI